MCVCLGGAQGHCVYTARAGGWVCRQRLLGRHRTILVVNLYTDSVVLSESIRSAISADEIYIYLLMYIFMLLV